MAKAGTRRTKQKVQVEALRARIWDMLLGKNGHAAKNQYEIADILNCTQQAVSYHIRRSLEAYTAVNNESAGEHLRLELARITFWESKAAERYRWAEAAWKKSIGCIQVITKSTKPSWDIDGKPTMLEPEVTVKELISVGDAKMLRAMNDADASLRGWAERRHKLLGLEAPKKVTVVDERDPANLPDSELEKAVMRMAEGLKTGIVLTAGANGNGNGHNGNGKPH